MKLQFSVAPTSCLVVFALLGLARSAAAGGCVIELPLERATTLAGIGAGSVTVGRPLVMPAGAERGVVEGTTGATVSDAKKYNGPPFFPPDFDTQPKTTTSFSVTTPVVNGQRGRAAINTFIGTIDTALLVQPGHTMSATFTLDPGQAFLCDWYDFHWVQIITQDDCKAKVAGVAASLPAVDTPAHGWDYMYNDLDVPPDGIQADERVASNTNDSTWDDDAVDTLPWYHTAPEEATDFTDCDKYPIDDTPGNCPAAGRTTFETYLVARAKGSTTSFCLLAGFEWSVSTAGNTGPTEITIDAAAGTRVQSGLGNGSIAGWTSSGTCLLTCLPIVGAPTLGPVGVVLLGLFVLATGAASWRVLRS